MRDLNGLKVCFVAGTLGQGGAERQLYYMLHALVVSGARPRVLSLTEGEFWEGPIRELGVPIRWVGRHASRAARLAAIAGDVRADRPDVLQSAHFYTNLYVAVAARLLGLREIGAIRNNATVEVESQSVLGRLSLRAPRIVAANSHAGIRNAIALGMPEPRLHFLPNVVDTHVFVPGPMRAHGCIRLLAVGRRVREKRFDRFLSVLAAVRQRSSRPVSGILVTTGTADRDALETLAARLGLPADAIEFREAVADMAPVYRCADVFLLTSDWEGTPNVVLEAMASGTAVVATRVGGVPDIVRHGDTGYLVDVDDDTAFVESVLALTADDGARAAMARRARDFIDEFHSIERLPSKLQDLYQRVSA